MFEVITAAKACYVLRHSVWHNHVNPVVVYFDYFVNQVRHYGIHPTFKETWRVFPH